jgi:hypothetical protein
MNHAILGILTAALLALGGCNKKSENPPPTATGSMSGSAASATGSGSPASATGSGSAASATGSGSAASATGSGSAASGAGSGSAAAVDVPTEQDFEAEAASKITNKNVEAQVQALEKQLAPEAK